MNRSEATALIATLAAAFPETEISEMTMEVYVTNLLDLDAEFTRLAVGRLQRASRGFPSIAMVRETVMQMTLDPPSLMAAWEQARTSGERHVVVDRARRMVGDSHDWRTLSSGELRPAFLAAYKEVLKGAVADLGASSQHRQPTGGEGMR